MIDPVIILVIVIAVLVLIFKFIRKRRKLSIYDFHALVVHCASNSIQSKHFDTEREKIEQVGKLILLFYFMLLVRLYHHPDMGYKLNSLLDPFLYFMNNTVSNLFDDSSVCFNVTAPVIFLNSSAMSASDIDKAVSFYMTGIVWHVTEDSPSLAEKLKYQSEIISAIYAYVPFLSDAMERIDLKNL